MANHDPNPNGPIVDYALTQRVILLIDLNPLISPQNPTQFISSLLCSVKILLSFSQLASSLFAFKFFFSSLSPLLSSSKVISMIPNSSVSLLFDCPAAILDSLSQTLTSLTSIDGESSEGCSPKASCLAASMRQLIHDYAWDPIVRDSITGTLSNCNPVVGIRSNLIVLFSPIRESFESLSEFLDVGVADGCFGNVSAFCEKFCGFFESVNRAFLKRDIQLSWVRVRCGVDSAGENAKGEESRLGFEFLESGFRNLGWGFCSTDSIVLGSALVPFGLIYPKIAFSPTRFCCDDSLKKLRAELCLDILDIAQKPLECKACELELVDLNPFPRIRLNCDILRIPEMQNSLMLASEMKNKFWEYFGDKVNKIQVKALYKSDEISRLKKKLSDPILVRETLMKHGRDKPQNHKEFFADKALRMISRELRDSMPKNSAPIWQILLSFLHREGYCAQVSVSNPSRNFRLGILEPFTVSSALLFIVHDGHEFIEADVALFDTTSNEASQPVKCSERDKKRSKRKKNFKVLEDQTWSSFCASAFEHSELELEMVYFSKQYRNSKKLRFLKCWMKQISKFTSDILVLEEKLKPPKQYVQKDVDNRLTEFHEEIEQPVSSSLENREVFLSNLSKRIQQGLDSTAIELGALARRLVDSVICWLNRKQESENATKSEDSTGELQKLLLKEPKDMIAKARSNDTSSQPPSLSTADRTLREYELQILFRMEILRSEVGRSIKGSLRNKFVKQICSLLETVPCHLEGGFFGDWSLDNYVGKIIKSRYNDTLEDVVNNIYKKMDLNPFTADDGAELPNCFLNSEDGHPNSKDKAERDELSGSVRVSEAETVDESLQQSNNGEETEEEHARKLLKAQERRVRARRFTSFTSWEPDLQKVWAPKQKKVEKPKSLPQRKKSKRKKQDEELNDTVCETPISKDKSSYSRDKDDRDRSSHSCPSVSKKLFQDDP